MTIYQMGSCHDHNIGYNQTQHWVQGYLINLSGFTYTGKDLENMRKTLSSLDEMCRRDKICAFYGILGTVLMRDQKDVDFINRHYDGDSINHHHKNPMPLSSFAHKGKDLENLRREFQLFNEVLRRCELCAFYGITPHVILHDCGMRRIHV